MGRLVAWPPSRCFAIALFFSPWVPAAAEERLPEPGPAEQKEAEKEVRKLFPPPGKDPAEVGRYARKLLEAGEGAGHKEALRFVILKQARELAAGAGDLETALAAARAVARAYRVDLGSMEVEALSSAARSQPRGGPSGVVRACLVVLEDVRRDHDFDAARRLASLVHSFSRKIDSAWLRANLEPGVEGLRRLEEWRKSVEEARGKLAANPEDPAASEVLGRFLCLVAGNWEEGLPHLGRSNNQKLLEAAKVELGVPRTPDRQYELGRAWWDLAQEEKEPALRKAMLLRGARWHGMALPSLSGLDRATALEQIERMPERFLCDMDEFDVAVGVGILGKGGELGHTTPEGETKVVVDGLATQRGLGTHAPKAGAARIKYALNRGFKRLRTCVAMNDSALAPQSSLTFTVKGDGKVLWKSRPVQKRGQSQLCEANVEGVVTLELSVECLGLNAYTHAVWLDPVVTR